MITPNKTPMPDMQCTFWPDGIPEWLGGKGNEWLGCCQTHDLSTQDLQSAIDLGVCVAQQGFAVMGAIMAAGVAVFGPLYLVLARARRNRF